MSVKNAKNIVSKISKNSNIKLIKGRNRTLKLYDITESELEELYNGSSKSTYLNFAIAFFSIGCSLLIALFTTQIDSDRKWMLFVLVTGLSFFGTIVFSLLWIKSYNSSKVLYEKIKNGE
ncbi:MAG: hypothetical protein SFU98_16380 [Leptospiraceae bacterium]|nr:hypothetical protein [Leptospiraceae bacterium]